MRTNIEFMSEIPEQFKSARSYQRESNQRAAEKVEPRKTLDWMIKQCLGSDAIGYADILPYASRQPNPYTFFFGNVEGIDTPATDGLLAEIEELLPLGTVTDEQWVEFNDKVVEFLMNMDDDDKDSKAARWAELDVEDNSWSDPESDPYMESQFAKDVADTANEWDFPKYTVGARNWGFYNEAATEGYAWSLMRVKWFASMLMVGGVQIKSNGLAKCGVSGCKWEHQLTSNSVEGSTVFDRRYAEYQVLLVLAHLGEHTRRNPENYWTPINEVRRGRDTATMKLDSASKFC